MTGLASDRDCNAEDLASDAAGPADRVETGPWSLAEMAGRSPIGLGDGAAVHGLAARPPDLAALFDGRSLPGRGRPDVLATPPGSGTRRPTSPGRRGGGTPAMTDPRGDIARALPSSVGSLAPSSDGSAIR
jgi:hypothetical protein